MEENRFRTFSEYIRRDNELLTPSAQDYMEMIYRLSIGEGFTRVSDLAVKLNVQPPSVTKMLHKLADLKLIKYEKYGVIKLENDGVEIGKALLERHNLIEEFLMFLNINDNILEETEKIEHTISERTLSGMRDIIDFFSNNKSILKEFNEFRRIRNIK